MAIVKIKKLNQSSKIPLQKYVSDAGFDSCLVKTGIAIKLPSGYEAQIRPRSGLALKNKITVLNSPGTIDEAFTGEIGVILINFGKKDYHVVKDDRIAQIVFKKTNYIEFKEVDSLEETSRNNNGFGSSGK
jgi:dUTP pyrophosphatase